MVLVCPVVEEYLNYQLQVYAVEIGTWLTIFNINSFPRVIKKLSVKVTNFGTYLKVLYLTCQILRSKDYSVKMFNRSNIGLRDFNSFMPNGILRQIYFLSFFNFQILVELSVNEW